MATTKKKADSTDQDNSGKPQWQIAMERLNKSFGANTVIIGNQKPADIPRVSTGSMKLDIELGGGLPLGRIVEVYGPNGTGKTTLCYHIIANGQKQGMKCAMIDMEHSMDANYAKRVGVNMDELILSQPDYGESALQIAKELIEAGVKIVIVDSVSALVPKAVMESDMGDQFPAIQGRMMSMSLMKLSPVTEKNGALLLFTNQIRSKVGVMYGPTETTSGGNALPFYAAVRLDMRRLKLEMENETSRTKVKVVKSKVSIPFKEVEIGLVWNEGFNRLEEILEVAVELEIVHKAGGHHSWGETKLGKSHDETMKFLKDNEEVAQTLESLVVAKLSPVTEQDKQEVI